MLYYSHIGQHQHDSEVDGDANVEPVLAVVVGNVTDGVHDEGRNAGHDEEGGNIPSQKYLYSERMAICL